MDESAKCRKPDSGCPIIVLYRDDKINLSMKGISGFESRKRGAGCSRSVTISTGRIARGGPEMPLRAASAIVAGVLAGAAQADQPLPHGGSYEVTFRLELPHLERWAIEKTTTVCVSNAGRPGSLPFPILSDNNPFAECLVGNVRQDGTSLTYEMACDGRGAAKLQASYPLAPNGFSGRIAMTMGAKNMTMTEVQAGRRVGSCELANMRQE
jgi:hypothetical protein